MSLEGSCEHLNDWHDFEFLRQEKTNVGFERNPLWRYEDVFYCKRCLQYKRVVVKHTVPRTDRFGERETSRTSL